MQPAPFPAYESIEKIAAVCKADSSVIYRKDSAMKVYNTLSKQKEEFVPLQPGKVSIYVCGPTVYNLIHIGNARPMIVFDTVRRYMEHKGYEVNYVSNFTDVDDKIIAKSIEEGVTAEEISTRYIAECKKDMEAMNVKACHDASAGDPGD